MQVGLKKYAAVSPSAFGLVGRKRIAVIRSAGAIVGGASCEPGDLFGCCTFCWNSCYMLGCILVDCLLHVSLIWL